MSRKQTPLCIVCTIVERGSGQKISKVLDGCGIGLHYRISGDGTASSDLLDILGFGTSERDVLISPASRKNARAIIKKIHQEGTGVRAKGILFVIPMTAASLRIVRAMERVDTLCTEEVSETVEKLTQQSLIIISVAPGYVDAVMNTAKAAGARGGTVIRSHIIRNDAIESLKGSTFAGERELIAIVASRAERNAIMERVDEAHGNDNAAHAILYSLPIEDTAHL